MDIMKWAKFGLAFGFVRTLTFAVLGAAIIAAVGTAVPGLGTEIAKFGDLGAILAVAGLVLLATSMVMAAIYMAVGGLIAPYMKKLVNFGGVNQVWASYGAVVMIAGIVLSPAALLLTAVMLLIDLLFIYLTVGVLKATKMTSWVPSV